MIIEKAYAKINLALEIKGVRLDGYHDLNMIMIPLDLHDILTFEISDDVRLSSNVIIDHNAVLKTISYMQTKYQISKGAAVTLEKHIPIGAGLGGGSADISATLRGLNRLWGLNLTLKELEEDANALGSDTLFCLYNEPAYVYGRGDKIEFIKPIDFHEIYLFTPGIEVSTKTVFQAYKHERKSSNFDVLIRYLEDGLYEKFFENTYNDLHKTAITTYKNLEKYENKLKKHCKNAYMTGSGSTYFFVNLSEKTPEFYKKMHKNKLNIIKTRSKH